MMDMNDETKMICYNIHDRLDTICLKRSCRHWIDHEQGLNCVFNTITRHDKTKLTLAELSEIYKVTRMRICQIEKSAIKKCRLRLNVLSS